MNIWKDFKRVPLPNLLSFIVDNRGKTVPTDPNGTHKLIATNCIDNEDLYPKYEKIRYLNDRTFNTWFRAHPKAGDIIFVCKGTPGKVCLVPDPVDFSIAQDMLALRVNSKLIYNKYLLAVLRSWKIQKQIEMTSIGDVIPHFKKSFLCQLEIPLPDMRLQKKIGDSYYKISRLEIVNKQINDNLACQLHIISDNYFSYFDFNNGSIPDNWTYKKLIDVAETTTGYSYKGKELIDSNNIGLATIKNFVKTGGFQSKGYKSIIPSKSVKQNQYASLFDILVAHTDLTQNADIIGNAEPVLTTKNFKKIIYSMDLVKVVPKQNKISKWLLDLILLSKRVKNHCLSYVNGTTVLHLSKKALKELEIPLPNDPDKLSNVTKIAKNYLLMMSRNIQENEKLIELKQQLINKYF